MQRLLTLLFLLVSGYHYYCSCVFLGPVSTEGDGGQQRLCGQPAGRYGVEEGARRRCHLTRSYLDEACSCRVDGSSCSQQNIAYVQSSRTHQGFYLRQLPCW
ncbi:uncharacterized protein LOC143299815 [Babylonia areolata]|uniref:uncharacterized protein LOC143299815 n=1 Tax=Babylonia areolata TaxID=304850 RepID=UPI003FD531A9